MIIRDMFKEDAWTDGTNAWSSEHDQWAKESTELVPALTGVDEELIDEFAPGGGFEPPKRPPAPRGGGDDDNGRPEIMPLEDVAKAIMMHIGDAFTCERMRDHRGKFNPAQPGYKFVPKDNTKFGMAKIWCQGDRRGEFPIYHTNLYSYFQGSDGKVLATGKMVEKMKEKTNANALRTAELIYNNTAGALKTTNEDSQVDEVAMNPKAFAKSIETAGDKGVLVGFEFETLIPRISIRRWKYPEKENAQAPVYNPDEKINIWLEGKTVKDLVLGIYNTNFGMQSRLDDLFKFKNGKKPANTRSASIYDYYLRWVKQRSDKYAFEIEKPIFIKTIKELLKSDVLQGSASSEGHSLTRTAEILNLPPDDTSIADVFVQEVKRITGIDLKKLKDVDVTKDKIDKVYRICKDFYIKTSGPVDRVFLDAASGAEDEVEKFQENYVSNSWDSPSRERFTAIAGHFAEFCQEEFGSDKLVDLLKNNWAFKGRVGNPTTTLKHKLWFFLTPDGDRPGSLPNRGGDEFSYKDGAEFLKDNLKDVFGNNIEIFTRYHQGTKKLDRWYIEPDGSLSPNSGDESAEVVSPPLKASEAIPTLRTFYKKAQEMGLYTNNSTGLHINVSIPDNLDVLKLATFVGDQHVLKLFGRQDTRYARSVVKSLKDNSDLPSLFDRDFKSVEAEMQKIVRLISGDHFASVNFNGKYVSFRHAGGDYLHQLVGIMNTVGRFIRAMTIAADPAAHRQEYIAKLVKMMKGPETAKGKESYSQIMSLAKNGIPSLVLYAIVTEPGSAIDLAKDAAKNWSYHNNNMPYSIVPDPDARQKILSSDISSRFQEKVNAAPDSSFFRMVGFLKNLEKFEDWKQRVERHGSSIGVPTTLWDSNGDSIGAFVARNILIMPGDPDFSKAVRVLRGERPQSGPLPLPGTKRTTAAQPAQQEPEQPQNEPAPGEGGAWTLNNARAIQHYVGDLSRERIDQLAAQMYAQTRSPVTISRDGVEQGRFPGEVGYHLINDQGSTFGQTIDNEQDARFYGQRLANNSAQQIHVVDSRGARVATLNPMDELSESSVSLSESKIADNSGAWPFDDVNESSNDFMAVDSTSPIHGGTSTVTENSVYHAIHRGIIATPAGRHLLTTYGLDDVIAAIEQVADSVGNVDEIGTSDVSNWIRQVYEVLNRDK